MATNKARNQTATVGIPECPVCLETMRRPIFLCQSGHSLCNACTSVLSPPNCPLCRQPMTKMRNWTLEDLADKAKVRCPNRAAGCVYTLSNAAVSEHLKECTYRQMRCPYGTEIGWCPWTGQLQQMMEHFKQKHPSVYIVGDEYVEMSWYDCRYFLKQHNKHLFIITAAIDRLQTLPTKFYFTVQLLGPEKLASQYFYAIHVKSKLDQVRGVIFTDHCYSDNVKAELIMRQNKCPVLTVEMLKQFTKTDKLSFGCVIRKVNDKLFSESGDATKNNDNASTSAGCSRGNGQPQGPRPKGPGKKGPTHKGPGPK